MSSPPATASPKRCRKCFYILDHLESRTCPECGMAFDPFDAATYTVKPPFVWWTFWMPAFLLAGVGGGILWTVLVFAFGFTASTTITVPIAMGVVVGYAGKVRIGFLFLLGLLVLAMALAILSGAGFLGGFCAAIVGVIALIPVAGGILAGWAMRAILKNSNFSRSPKSSPASGWRSAWWSRTASKPTEPRCWMAALIWNRSTAGSARA